MTKTPKRLEILKDRAYMLKQARFFFDDRGIIEVDCPLLSPSASVDAHIDLIPVHPVGETRYLHSSPEYGMKRLLAEGIQDIYQLSHVFRNGESGAKHNPEFMMAEWYRIGISFHQMIEETLNFIRLFLGDLKAESISYRQLFLNRLNIDPATITTIELLRYLKENNIELYDQIELDGKDGMLNILMGTKIEPQLGQNRLTALTYYPASQAALARTLNQDGMLVAERFEIYYNGVELANGYHELADANEQQKRLEEANEQRLKMKKDPLPIDTNFLAALKTGLPDCCGVAVGFDRLMMLRHQQKQIANVIPFVWADA